MAKVLRLVLIVVLVSFSGLPALAQVPVTEDDLAALQEAVQQLISQGDPVKEEQVVYSITPWTGGGIGTGTFAPKHVDTIYVIANTNNLFNVRRTEVYYWPITREYMANWFEKNETLEGKLRIRSGNETVALLDLETYVDYYPQGASSARQWVFGEEGVRLYEEYDAKLDAYYQESLAYYEKQIEHQRTLDAILRRVNETGEYVAEDEVPKAPRAPSPPTEFVYAPRTAYVVNLPAGRYEIELVDANGEPVPETRKKLHVFEARRSGVGYNVLPEHKWTRAFQTNNPAEVLYLEGRRIFYLQPRAAEEYNVYQYFKSQNLQQPTYGEGLRSSWFWVQTEPLDPNVKMQILRDGEVVQEVSYKPYYVRQTQGYALGYNILEFDPDDPIMFQRQPSFYAYRVELEATRGSYALQLVDSEGNVIPESYREIRSIRQDRLSWWTMYLVPLIPMLIGTVVYIRRRRLRPRAGKVQASA